MLEICEGCKFIAIIRLGRLFFFTSFGKNKLPETTMDVYLFYHQYFLSVFKYLILLNY